jgi:ribosomal protein S12 methylthiotransferase
LPHFAYLKIAEGCDNFCSYCTIPSLRGQKRSRSIQSIRDEAASLLNNGVKELILIAQDTTAYGEKGKNNLPGLIRELDKLDGDFWIRILYTHPAAYNEHIIEALAESEHVIPYLDIPVQHISHRILNSMNRKTCSREIKELITRLRSSIKHLTLRTTFITGYPGETEKEFSELIEFIKEYRFERVGAFPYYPEPGTTAADLPGQLPFSTAEDRCAELMEIQSKISLNINKSLVGKTFDVIIDFQEGRKFRGRTYMDAPEIDNSVEITSKKDISPGTFQKVKITGAGKYDLKGIVL